MKIRIIGSLLCFFTVICCQQVLAQNHTLSLEAYLCQVKRNNAGLIGTHLISQGARQRVGEGRLIMKPSLFVEGQYVKDSFNPNWSPIVGNTSNTQSYQVGVSQTTPYGMQGKLYYSYQHQSISGVTPLKIPTQVTASSPILELEMSLARNWAGRETRANAQLIDSQARLIHHSERYKIKLLLAQAETAYWRLAITRNLLRIQHDSLTRAIKTKEWVDERARVRLAETADLLQAQAAVDARKLDIEVALNDERLAARNFNTLRGANEDVVCEDLCSFNCELMNNLPSNCPPNISENVKAAEQEQNIAVASALLGIEKNKPSLSLYASYALNGNNPSTNLAIAESFTTDFPSTAIGLRLSMPLDLIRLSKDRNAYQNEIRGAHCQLKQKIYENQRLWEDLMLKLNNAKERLHIAIQLENIQSRKVEVERHRLMYGKTTTYQVLQFEQEYANAQIGRLAIEGEILELNAQLKTFGV